MVIHVYVQLNDADIVVVQHMMPTWHCRKNTDLDPIDDLFRRTVG